MTRAWMIRCKACGKTATDYYQMDMNGGTYKRAAILDACCPACYAGGKVEAQKDQAKRILKVDLIKSTQ